MLTHQLLCNIKINEKGGWIFVSKNIASNSTRLLCSDWLCSLDSLTSAKVKSCAKFEGRFECPISVEGEKVIKYFLSFWSVREALGKVVSPWTCGDKKPWRNCFHLNKVFKLMFKKWMYCSVVDLNIYWGWSQLFNQMKIFNTEEYHLKLRKVAALICYITNKLFYIWKYVIWYK